MAKPALHFSRLSVGGRILRIRQIVKATTGNSVYLSPTPTLAAITAAVDKLEDYEIVLLNGGTSATTIRNAQNKYVLEMMNLFVAYVTIESGGDQIKIESTSLAIKKPPKRLGKMPQVVGLKGITGIFPGDVKLRLKAIKGKRYYSIQKSTDGLTNWLNAGKPCTKAKITITGLVVETASFFRVSAGNVLGLGPFSKPVRLMAK